MKLVAIAALIAVCGAAKLDRTYLPPASAKTAGGSPGSLQTPFSGNSLNNGLGGLPKGSFTNEFQGVVVDAAAPGTRASEEGETGLGAPRISYGSTNSKVGSAAFKVSPSGFGQDAQVAGTQNQGFQTPAQRGQSLFGSQVSGNQAGETPFPSGQSQSPFRSQNRFGSQATLSQNQFGVEGGQNQFTSGQNQVGSENGQNQFGNQAGQGLFPSGQNNFGSQTGQNQFGNQVGQSQFPSGQNQLGGPAGQSQFPSGQNQFGSQTGQNQFGSQAGQNVPERARAALDRAATTLRFENEVGPESFSYAFETDNGISAEENGVATNGVQAQGGFSYTGDDGQVYSLTYTADEGGYQPKGDHLPTPPPIPEEILRSLEKNARDEAAGLVDDGSYDAQKYNVGSDYAESDGSNGKYNHQSSVFGNTETDATASGTFISPNNQPFRNPVPQSRPNDQSAKRPTSTNEFSGATGQNLNAEVSDDSTGQFASPSIPTGASNRLPGSLGTGSSSNTLTGPSASAGFRQPGLSGTGQGSNNGFGSPNLVQGGASRPGLANNKEYLPPVNSFNQNGRPQGDRPQNSRPQNGRPQNGRPQNTPQGIDNSASSTQLNQESSADVETSPDFQLQQNGQNQGRPQGSFTSSPFSRPNSGQNVFDSDSGSLAQNKPGNGFRPNSASNLVQDGITSQTAGNAFANNEYLPPVNQGTFGQNRPQYTQTSDNNQALPQFGSQGRPSSFPNMPSSLAPATGSQGAFGSQSNQQVNRFQRPQSNRKPSLQNQNQINEQSQATQGFNINSQKATSQPDTELTTPFETSSADISKPSQRVPSSFASSRPNGRPGQSQFGNRFNAQGDSSAVTSPAVPPFGSPSSSRPGSTFAPFGSAQTQVSVFTTPSPQDQIDQTQFNQELQYSNQKPRPQSAFSQTEDVQYSSSTQRPSFAQQVQGPDDSYYYDQPSKPFGAPQGSRFPVSSSNQFSRVPQRPTNGQFPIPPTLPSTTFSSQNGLFQGSNKYPRPPTLNPTSPTSSSQNYQSNTVSGITQAAISSFPSEPTQSSQFNSQGQFGSRPGFPGASSSKPSFGQSLPTQPSFSQKPIESSQNFLRPGSKPGAFQVSQTFGQQSQSQVDIDDAQPVSSQQYQGQIYEYNKPAQTLPAPDSKDSTASGQFGQKVQGQFGPRPQFGQKPESTQTSAPQSGQKARPQFGAQFSQTSQSDGTSSAFGSKPQFGSQGQSQDNNPQFGAQKPFSQSKSENQAADAEEAVISQEAKPFGFDGNAASAGRPNSCCRPSGQFGPVKLTKGSQDGRPSSQLGVQNSGFPGAPTSFSGKGEAFGGPRKPPSFDDQTGYHY